MLDKNKAIELKDEDLEKVTGGFQVNDYGNINLKSGETFETGTDGHHFVYVVQNDYTNIWLSSRIEVLCKEYHFNLLTRESTEELTLRTIFDNCDIDWWEDRES